MTKNKLPWIIAVFLIVSITAIPIAYAQTAFGGSLVFVLINALIVGIVLFILQSFLLPQKEGKEKTVVYTAIILGSLLIAFLYGQSGFIWQGPLGVFFSVYVIVNTAVISIFLYFLLGLLKINEKLGLQSTEGKTGYGLLIFFISAVFAVLIGSRFVWQQSAIAQLVAYLFGPQGILNPNWGLFTFIGVAALLSFFFNNYLFEGGAGGNKWINYALAIIIGASVATGGYSIRTVFVLAEIVFILVLAKAVKTGNKWADYFIAVVLVGWASAASSNAITNGQEYYGILGWIFGNVFAALGFGGAAGAVGVIGTLFGIGGLLTGISGIVIFSLIAAAVLLWKWRSTGSIGGALKSPWVWIILIGGILLAVTGGAVILVLLLPLILLFGAGAFVMTRGKGRSRLLGEAGTRLLAALHRRLRDMESLSKFLSKYGYLRTPTLKGELPFSLQDLKVELYTLMNYMLRHEIYERKFKSVREMYEELGKKETRLSEQILNSRGLAGSMRGYVEGAQINKVDPEGSWKVAEDPETRRPAIGWARQYYFIFNFMEDLKSLLQQDLTIQTTQQSAATRAEDALSTFQRRIDNEYETTIDAYYGKFMTDVRRFRTYNLTSHLRIRFLDMYNMYGIYQRGYSFARYGAKPYIYRIEEGGLDNAGFFREIDWTKVKLDRAATEETMRRDSDNLEPGTQYLEEVNIYGFSIRDINGIQVEGRADTSIRRWLKEDIQHVYHPNTQIRVPRFSHIVDFASKDWAYVIRDMEMGSYHRFSRKVNDYEVLEGYYDLDKMQFKKLLDYEDVALDREALKNGGLLYYLARKKYHEGTHDSLLQVKPINPLPAVTLFGLWTFVQNFAEKATKEAELAKKYLDEYYKMGYDKLEKAPKKEGS